MRKVCVKSVTFMAVILTAVLFMGERVRAEVNTRDGISYDEDSGLKASIRERKSEIAKERQGILEAWARLRQARATRDKAHIERVRKEVDEEVAKRKVRISDIKNEIEVMQDGGFSFAPGSKSRTGEVE